MKRRLDIIRDVSARLDGANIGYMLTGSMAMNYYAPRRRPGEIDIVVAPAPSDATEIIRSFSQGYFFMPEMADRAIASTSVFSLFPGESEIKVNCIMLKQTEDCLTEFNRRQRIRIKDFETWIVSREDLILAKIKLLWMKDMHSAFHLSDIKDLASRSYDLAYINRRTWGLGIASLEQAVSA